MSRGIQFGLSDGEGRGALRLRFPDDASSFTILEVLDTTDTGLQNLQAEQPFIGVAG